MDDRRRRLALSLGLTSLLVLILLSILAAPPVYARLAGRRMPETETDTPQSSAPERASITAMEGESPFPLTLNTATAEQLALVPQIGWRTARQVIELRDMLGGYDSLEQLARFFELNPDGLEDYLVVGSYTAGRLPASLDAEAQADRLLASIAEQLAQTDLEDAAQLAELISLMESGRERLVALIGEDGVTGRTDFDEVYDLLVQRLAGLTGKPLPE